MGPWLALFLVNCSLASYFTGEDLGTQDSPQTQTSSEVIDSAHSDIAASAFAGALTQAQKWTAHYKKPFSLFPVAHAGFCAANWATATCNGVKLSVLLGTGNSPCEADSREATLMGSWDFLWTQGSCKTSPLQSEAGSVFYQTPGSLGVTRVHGQQQLTLLNPNLQLPLSGLKTQCGLQGCEVSRTLTLMGSHYRGYSQRVGVWDHQVVSIDPVLVQGTGLLQEASEGSVKVLSVRSSDVSVSRIQTPLQFGSNCCFPISGSLKTQYTKGPLEGRTQTLRFSSTCGRATLIDEDQKTESVVLTHCL